MYKIYVMYHGGCCGNGTGSLLPNVTFTRKREASQFVKRYNIRHIGHSIAWISED